MNNLVELLQNIYNQGWQLWSENGQLYYDAPEDQSTESILATLKQHKTEILKLLPAYQNQLAKNLVQETDRWQPVVVPLTEAQKQLWFLDQLDGNSKQAYVESMGLQLEGAFQIEAMEQAIQKIVERHEALRTRICSEGDFQEVLPSVKIQVPLIDFSNSSASERESQVAQWLAREIREPFNLSQAPLLRVHILKLEKKLHQLVLKTHHIISDGFSRGIILQEIAALYSAQCQENIFQLEPPMQFREYIELQNKRSQAEEMAAHKSYWLEKFSSSVPILNLPTDRPRPSIMSYRGGRQTLKLDAKLCTQIKRLSRQKGCTLFMTLLATYKILLHKLTGDEDIVVGIPTTGRDFEESQNLVGYCTHLLPIKTSLFSSSSYKSLTFSEFLRQMRGILLDDYEHQDYPFSQLLNKLNLKRDPSRPILVSTLFNLNPSQTAKLLGLKTSLMSIPRNFLDYDLFLDITETEDELWLDLDYNLDLFEGTTIRRWLTHFQNLLLAIAENPQVSVGELPLLSEAERYKLLREWNDTTTEYPRDKCIHQLFEEQVEKTPDAVAVEFNNQQLTYQQLNQRANQLAHHLQSKGVGPEVLVGICVERSLEMVVGLWGILKAGSAYVPLDPNYPQERLSYMLSDSQLAILLTQQHLLKQLPQHQIQTLCLDEDWQNLAEYSQENPCGVVKSDNLAYIIYTSGSTGKPKGTMILHRGMVNYLSWCTKAYNVASGVGSTVNSSIGFDATITSLFSPLLVGGKVVLLPEEGEIEALKAALSSGTEFSLVKITPAHLQILSHLLAEKQVNIKTQAFIIGGEALSEKVTSFWQKHAPATRLINEYGPTETVVGCCIYEVGKQSLPGGGNIPIGCPIANTQIYILDKHLQPLPIGVPGELYIGGDGLARGYLNRPQLTQEKFIPNPFSNSPSERLYKTGDLARYLPNGNIEFLGRIDNQVKVRGFRIELGEIESILNTHPQIKQAVVIAMEDIPGSKRLVAYVVTSDESLSTNQLREFLLPKLPEYMVPSAFVTLDTLPLTANGKVDRKALPAPDRELTSSPEYVLPQTETERLIAEVLQEVLQLEKVSIYDNFFELGANSIILVKINSKLRKIFSIELPIIDMFTYPNIKILSQHIAKNDTPKPLGEAQLLNRNQIKYSLKKRRRLRKYN